MSSGNWQPFCHGLNVLKQVKVMAFCSTATSHNLNQCRLNIDKVVRYLSHGIVYLNTQDIISQDTFEIYIVWNHNHISQGEMSR